MLILQIYQYLLSKRKNTSSQVFLSRGLILAYRLSLRHAIIQPDKKDTTDIHCITTIENTLIKLSYLNDIQTWLFHFAKVMGMALRLQVKGGVKVREC